MLGRMARPDGGGVSEQRRQREAAFDFGRRHTGSAAVPLSPPPPPKLLFLAAATASGVVSGEKETMFSPPAELAGAVVVTVSPSSTLQPPASSPITSAAATAVPFSWRGPTSSSSSSSSGGQQRPWEARRPVRVGLAGALNGDGDAFQPAATTVLTTGQRMIRPCRQSQSSASSALVGSPESRCRSRCVLSPREVMMEASSEDYTRVIARGPKPRTMHIFDDRVVVVEHEFLRWCHGCSKDLRQGNDIFMYRGEMAFCSHECRYREMLLSDEQEGSN